MAVNAHFNSNIKTDSNMSTNKNNNYFTKRSQYTESIDAELCIVEKPNLLNENTVEPSTIIEDLIITKTKLSKHEFCRKMKQQCNIRFYDAIKLWKKYNQQLQPEGNCNDKNNII
eukprot:208484_1